MFQTKVVEKIKTQILRLVTFFFFNLSLYEIMSENIAYRGRPKVTIWRMRTAICIPKATNAHSEYALLIVCPLQKWLHARASMLH
jgi:hypothetical protein